MDTAFSLYNSADGSTDTSYRVQNWCGARHGADRKQNTAPMKAVSVAVMRREEGSTRRQ